MFEQIDNNYIVIGLIILTLVCVYLLYTNLTSGNDSIELKKHINELVLQNKKRDEIIHFLVNQVQLIQSQPPITEITTHESIDNENLQEEEPVNTVQNEIDKNEMNKLDKLLEVDFSTTEEKQDTEDESNEKSSETSEEQDKLVDSILSSDKLPPKDKDLLYVYTVSQLKDFAKELNLSTGGNKDVLINRIYNSL
jgi:hypothetical protein